MSVKDVKQAIDELTSGSKVAVEPEAFYGGEEKLSDATTILSQISETG